MDNKAQVQNSGKKRKDSKRLWEFNLILFFPEEY